MNSANASHDRPTAGLASWYTPGRSDGFGDRLLMFDNTDAISLELLRFRRELATTIGFEHALRDRVERLASLRDPVFPALRAVVHLDDRDLTLVSAHTAGQRLSDLPTWKVRRGLHPAVVTWIVRELTPALARLQAAGPGVAHGALNADRILLASDGGLRIVEHALGSALRRLELTPAVFWRRFGLLAPPDDRGVIRLDQRTDIVQLGVIALSLLLGRTVTLHDFERSLPALLDEFTALAAISPSAYAEPLRIWIERALQLGSRPYRSAEDAQEQLDELPAPAPQMATVAGGTDRQSSASSDADEDVLSGALPPATLPLKHHGIASHRPPAAALTETAALADLPVAGPSQPPGRRWRRTYTGAIAVVLGVIAVVEGAIIAGLGGQPTVVSVPAPALAIPVSPATAPAPGNDRLANPLQGGTPPGDGGAVSTMTAAATANRDAALIQAAAARQRPGGIRWSAPIALNVFEGDRILGSTTDGPIVMPAGTHRVELVNAALGYRAEQTVTVRSGVITSLTVSPPTGRLNINAQPWALVLIDNSPIGETPLANVAVPLGEHQITFRHPQLGERRETVLVRADATARVSATFDR